MVLHMLSFLMCFVGMYVLTSPFLSVGDAENLSLLTSDTYGVAWADVQSTVEIILVMKLPAEQTRRLSWRHDNVWFVCIPYGASSCGGSLGSRLCCSPGLRASRGFRGDNAELRGV